MQKIRAAIDEARIAFTRLTQREQLIAAGGMAALVLVVLVGVGALISHAIEREERRVRVKTDQLVQVLALQNDYRARQLEREQRLRSLSGAQTRLVSLVEESARRAGVDIGQLRPDDGEPDADNIMESRVDLRAAGLSIDRLQEFLNALEKSPGVVMVRRLKMTRPYRKDTADVEMTVSTYRVKN